MSDFINTKQPSKSLYDVDARLLRMAKAGMNTILTNLGLQWADSSAILTGSRVLDDASKEQYKVHYRGLRWFCCLIGDYHSLIILQNNSPQPYCPPMNAETIQLFIR